MGQKVNPIGLRLGVNRTWDSRWYASRGEYARLLLEDLKMREHILTSRKQAGISKVVIERPHKKCRVTVHTARPGILIGKKGADIVTVANSFNWGDLAFDPSAPIDEASAVIDTTAFAFTRTFGLAGRLANAGVMLPVIGGHLEGLYLGEPAEVSRFGLGDPRLRLAINLYGAPAVAPQAFTPYRQRGILGVSVTVAPPLGQYDSTKLINLGNHRWSVKPEVGVSHAFDRWVVEAMAGVWLFTDNADFLGGRTREQDPITATQLHVTFRFKPTMWLAADANYFTGGQTTIGGKQNLDLQRNSRIGATFSSSVSPRQQIRISVSRGAYTTIGADFTSVAAGYNYAWTR